MTMTKYNYKEATEKASERTENTVFLKLKDGETVKGMFTGDVLESITHYLPDQKKSVSCEGTDCIHCTGGLRQNVKYYQNFIMFDEGSGKYEARVFGVSSVFMKNLRESLLLSESTREKSVLAIKRTGEKLDTEYHIQVIKQMDLPEIELIDLDKIVNY